MRHQKKAPVPGVTLVQQFTMKLLEEGYGEAQIYASPDRFTHNIERCHITFL